MTPAELPARFSQINISQNEKQHCIEFVSEVAWCRFMAGEEEV